MEKFKIDSEKIKAIQLSANEKFKIINKNLSEKKIKEKYVIKKPFFIFVSTIEPRKNLERIIKAFKIFKEKNPEYNLLIMGRYGWKSKKTIEIIKRDKSIIHLNNVPDEDLIYFYNLAECLLYPSLYEGFGLPVLEAMRCGCPVITSNTSSMPEVGGNAVILVNPRSIIEIKNSMEKIKNKSLRENLIKLGLKRSKDFSWKKCAKETLGVYENLNF